MRQRRERQGVIRREHVDRHGRSVSGIGERLEVRATVTAPVAGIDRERRSAGVERDAAQDAPPHQGLPRIRLAGRRREAVRRSAGADRSRPWRRAAAGCAARCGAASPAPPAASASTGSGPTRDLRPRPASSPPAAAASSARSGCSAARWNHCRGRLRIAPGPVMDEGDVVEVLPLRPAAPRCPFRAAQSPGPGGPARRGTARSERWRRSDRRW